jgi:hypothetical protein
MSANKRKGTTHESAIVNYLTSQGISARRVVQTGRFDQGDIHAEADWILEAKNCKDITPSEFVRQAVREAVNAGRSFGVAVVKKRNANIKDSYVMTDLETFARILHKLRECDGRTENP